MISIEDMKRIRDQLFRGTYIGSPLTWDKDCNWYIIDGPDYIEPIVITVVKQTRHITFSFGTFATTNVEELFDHILVRILSD